MYKQFPSYVLSSFSHSLSSSKYEEPIKDDAIKKCLEKYF